MDYCVAYNLYEKGFDAFCLREFKTAIDCFEKSLDHAVHYKTLERLGECYFVCGDTTKAIIYLGAAVALNRGAKPRRLLAQAFLTAGYYELALEFADHALAIAPGYKLALQIKEQAESKLKKGNL